MYASLKIAGITSPAISMQQENSALSLMETLPGIFSLHPHSLALRAIIPRIHAEQCPHPKAAFQLGLIKEIGDP